jgi:hypothetical protein
LPPGPPPPAPAKGPERGRGALGSEQRFEAAGDFRRDGVHLGGLFKRLLLEAPRDAFLEAGPGEFDAILLDAGGDVPRGGRPGFPGALQEDNPGQGDGGRESGGDPGKAVAQRPFQLRSVMAKTGDASGPGGRRELPQGDVAAGRRSRRLPPRERLGNRLLAVGAAEGGAQAAHLDEGLAPLRTPGQLGFERGALRRLEFIEQVRRQARVRRRGILG